MNQMPAPGEVEDMSHYCLVDLVDHIQRQHHAHLCSELPRLEMLTSKVAMTHGRNDPRLESVRTVFAAMTAELLTHLAKEEQVLFPMIRVLEASGDLPAFHCGSIAHPIACMGHDPQGSQYPVSACGGSRAQAA